MPQLLPFYYTHEVVFIFFVLALLLSLFSKYILPNMLSVFLGRSILGDKMNS